jgi:dihydroorotate dehydrogenase
MCMGELPLIVSLPTEQVLSFGPRVVDAGADAVSMAAPKGALPVAKNDGVTETHLVTGRLYGPSLFPRSLEVVSSAAKLGLPIIASGGVQSNEDSNVMFSAGAMAVQLDVILWRGDWQ